jgi:tetrapyrrole methylase family protein/MazG family protein
LKPYLIEECYEVLQALDEGIPEKLCDELGDLLLQIMLHAQIADEVGQFTVDDVIRGLIDKLIYRHPHVFADTEVEDAAHVKRNWELLKREEREEESLLSTVPKSMPSLSCSQSIQRRVGMAGFDWEEIEGVIDKLAEEVDELKHSTNLEEKSREFGDLLFTLANIARRMEVDLETSLQAANERFYRRFTFMEKLCKERGLVFGELPFKTQNVLWEEAKQQVG